jgi:hypothetical protein
VRCRIIAIKGESCSMEGQRHGKPKELHTSRVVNSKFRPEDRRKKERKKRSRVLERVHLASSSILTDILIFIITRARWRFIP